MIENWIIYVGLYNEVAMAFLEKAVDFCACDAHVSRIIVPISINFKEDWKLSDYYVF